MHVPSIQLPKELAHLLAVVVHLPLLVGRLQLRRAGTRLMECAQAVQQRLHLGRHLPQTSQMRCWDCSQMQLTSLSSYDAFRRIENLKLSLLIELLHAANGVTSAAHDHQPQCASITKYCLSASERSHQHAAAEMHHIHCDLPDLEGVKVHAGKGRSFPSI